MVQFNKYYKSCAVGVTSEVGLTTDRYLSVLTVLMKHDVFYLSEITEVTWYELLYNISPQTNLDIIFLFFRIYFHSSRSGTFSFARTMLLHWLWYLKYVINDGHGFFDSFFCVWGIS